MSRRKEFLRLCMPKHSSAGVAFWCANRDGNAVGFKVEGCRGKWGKVRKIREMEEGRTLEVEIEIEGDLILPTFEYQRGEQKR